MLIHSKTKLLVDCGYIVPLAYFGREFAPDYLDAIYLTHCHGDHTFGLPALLTRLYEDGRKKPLLFIGQPGTEALVIKIVDTAYPNIRKHFGYSLNFIETVETRTVSELNLAFAETKHGAKNYAVRISDGTTTIGVSGDGEATAESIELFADCDVLIHEAFQLADLRWGHSSAKQIQDFARTYSKLRLLGFVHISRAERKVKAKQFLEIGQSLPFDVRMPEAGEIWDCASLPARRTS